MNQSDREQETLRRLERLQEAVRDGCEELRPLRDLTVRIINAKPRLQPYISRQSEVVESYRSKIK